MATTKEMTREERKATKRTQRKELVKLYTNLTRKQRAEFAEKKRGGVKGFLAGTNEENE